MMYLARAIISTAYFPPVQYFCKLYKYGTVLLETQEHFSKQTYRNRCVIYSANGTQTLSVPIVNGRSSNINIKDITIDYSENWQKQHLKSIESAYRSSPFYEFFIDDILYFFSHRYKFLLDLNIDITNIVIKAIGLNVTLIYTDKFEKDYTIPDFRYSIHPKQRMQTPDAEFNPINYKQVFDNKYGFISNLSVLDLLFNEGTNTINILNQSNCVMLSNI